MLTLDHLEAECEVAGMRISTAKSKAMTLTRKPDCLLRVGNESLAQVKEFKYLGILLLSVRLAGESEQRGRYCVRFTAP